MHCSIFTLVKKESHYRKILRKGVGGSDLSSKMITLFATDTELYVGNEGQSRVIDWEAIAETG